MADLEARIEELGQAIAGSDKDSEKHRVLSAVMLDYRRLQVVRDSVGYRSDELKKHYFKIFKERNVYFEKLRLIESFGEEQNWTGDDKLLEQIHEHLNQQKN